MSASCVINRGFGGSQIVDSAHFADRIIFPYAPRMIFLRARGNDLWAGKSAEQVFAEFIQAQLPSDPVRCHSKALFHQIPDQHERPGVPGAIVEALRIVDLLISLRQDPDFVRLVRMDFQSHSMNCVGEAGAQ